MNDVLDILWNESGDEEDISGNKFNQSDENDITQSTTIN